MSEQDIVLRADSINFFSSFDEDAFFGWVQKIRCITHCYGKGLSLLFVVRAADLGDIELRELLALFHRYEVDMKQLAAFETAENRLWFRSARSYWYSQVFSS